jgi:DnaK suppressor protein
MNAPIALTRPEPDAVRTESLDATATQLHEALADQHTQLADLQVTIDELRGQPDAEASGRDVAERALQATLETIRDIEAALHRAELGTYGQCERCGGAIPAARLEVVPYASHCVQCPASPRLIG